MLTASADHYLWAACTLLGRFPSSCKCCELSKSYVERKCKVVATDRLHVGCFLHRNRRTCRLKAAEQLRIRSRDRNYNNQPLQPTRGDTLGEFLIVVCVVSVPATYLRPPHHCWEVFVPHFYCIVSAIKFNKIAARVCHFVQLNMSVFIIILMGFV